MLPTAFHQSPIDFSLQQKRDAMQSKIKPHKSLPKRLTDLARLIHEPAALGRAGFDVSVAA